VEKRGHLIPKRVLECAEAMLAKNPNESLSLMQLHKMIYAPLLNCETLEQAQKLFPEFENMKDVVVYQRKSKYRKDFEKRTDSNFALKMLQEFWCNLKTKEEIAEALGMKSRTSLEWPLKMINFVGYDSNYKTILNASDNKGNELIASKVKAWNALHPDLVKARNKHAAQGCKTEEYRAAQSERMKQYDIEHPERREKIGLSSKLTWELCPDVRAAMSEFASKEQTFVKRVVMKAISGAKLTEREQRINKGFYKRFWTAYPELKAVYAEARKKASEMAKKSSLDL